MVGDICWSSGPSLYGRATPNGKIRIEAFWTPPRAPRQVETLQVGSNVIS
jgi:hypothetical protein